MKQFSIPRRIWRIINPLIIYLAITLAVGIIFAVSLGLALAIQGMIGGGLDITDLAAEMQRITIEYSMPILITGNVVALGAFLPMWLNSRKRIERSRNVNPAVNYALTFGLFAAFNLVVTCVISLLDSAFDIMSYFRSYEGVGDVLTQGTFLAQLIALGVGAPIVEEMCFRGILMERMRWIPVWLAVFIQALLFAIAHMNLFQGSYAFILGIMLALAYVKFRSLIVVIIGHAAFNITSVVQSTIAPEANLFALLIPGVVVTIVCAVFLIKRPSAIVIPLDVQETSYPEPPPEYYMGQ